VLVAEDRLHARAAVNRAMNGRIDNRVFMVWPPKRKEVLLFNISYCIGKDG
jgi:hypothetical protein